MRSSASDKFDIHLPTLLVIPLVTVIGAVVGYLVGLPSKRLIGDYLAIVTLFFLLVFGTITTNGNNVRGHDLTSGANGILNVDPLSFFGHELQTTHEGIFSVAYFYVVLAAFVVVYVLLRFVNDSRTGRAWRSLREDSLAAELMGMPVNGLKLLRLLVRRGRGGIHRHVLRGSQRQRLPAELLLRAADHGLHDGHSRRRRAARRGSSSARFSSA